MDFYMAKNFKKTDSWDYFFPLSIAGCSKNKIGSKIIVWDTGSTACLFSFIKKSDEVRLK